MEPVLCFEESTDTIRQLPENYRIAYRENGRWVCEPDLAANRELASRVFNALFDYETKYGDGCNLLAKVTPNSNFKKIPTIPTLKWLENGE